MLDRAYLDLGGAVGRFAVAYVRKVCAQAHVGFVETSPGEDLLAIDGLINYPSFDTRVQIKGSTGPSLAVQEGTLNFAIEDKWRIKWAKNDHPAYFIYVLMERDVPAWFEYGATSTLAGAYALWARVDDLPADAEAVVFDRANRFTSATVGAWYQDELSEGFGEEVVDGA